MIPGTGYIVVVLAIAFVITLGLRAIPFAILKPLRESRIVRALSVWMPVGILAILAASTFHSTIVENARYLVPAVIAAGTTIAVHLLFGRRTLLSVGLGTLTFVVLVNLPL
ncbi:MAG TPA: AzlD domain-containing protein [Candidatus Microbacterium stercoravium]|uniref:AzlD domain-containing protein n=1 Tax=Candidatus Microbacterium stercoravium TaxID=2838697 RepID=A0A9D2KGG2_9MICO|nr:AzlD domain-containing protein [Candidatus Microbacterium stercoravium]